MTSSGLHPRWWYPLAIANRRRARKMRPIPWGTAVFLRDARWSTVFGLLFTPTFLHGLCSRSPGDCRPRLAKHTTRLQRVAMGDVDARRDP